MPTPRTSICPRCQTRPRHRSPSGRLNSYCSPCAVARQRESKGYAPAVRACSTCKKPYRGNSRAKTQLCPECRVLCATCGKKKTSGDGSHSECFQCRSTGRTCTTCGIKPALSNKRVCWDCLSADETELVKRRNYWYNLPPGWLDQKLTEQGGVCEISGQPETSVNKRTGKVYPLAIDHDRACCPGNRSCGKCLRGLIRRNLNVALGMFNDDPELLRAAADYIERYRKSTEPRVAGPGAQQ
jgi:Recombination endonuclease VII